MSNEKVLPSNTSTLCWQCKKACGGCGCSWVHEHKPVKGWVAKHTIITDNERPDVDSFIVISCPLFERDCIEYPSVKLICKSLGITTDIYFKNKEIYKQNYIKKIGIDMKHLKNYNPLLELVNMPTSCSICGSHFYNGEKAFMDEKKWVCIKCNRGKSNYSTRVYPNKEDKS